jgi:hypothetical protein
MVTAMNAMVDRGSCKLAFIIFSNDCSETIPNRAKNAICPKWSPLDRVKQCHLKVGAEIVIGAGTKAQCYNNITCLQSPNTQVYVPNNTRDSANIRLGVTDCLGDA